MSGAPRPVQPPGRPPDFNGLINGLLTDAPVPRRLQTAASLCTVLRAPENAAFVQQAFSQLLHAFEQMLYDRAEPIRWQAPLLLGALAAEHHVLYACVPVDGSRVRVSDPSITSFSALMPVLRSHGPAARTNSLNLRAPP